MTEGPEEPSERADIVRAAYERFNERDFAGALRFFHDDARLDDALLPGTVVHGKHAIEWMWRTRFGSAAAISASAGPVYESGDTVVALVSYEAYGPEGVRVGDPVVLLQRLRFQQGLIVHMESRSVEDIPQTLRDLFLAPSAETELAVVRREIEALVFSRRIGPSFSPEELAHYEALCDRELGTLSYLGRVTPRAQGALQGDSVGPPKGEHAQSARGGRRRRSAGIGP